VNHYTPIKDIVHSFNGCRTHLRRNGDLGPCILLYLLQVPALLPYESPNKTIVGQDLQRNLLNTVTETKYTILFVCLFIHAFIYLFIYILSWCSLYLHHKLIYIYTWFKKKIP